MKFSFVSSVWTVPLIFRSRQQVIDERSQQRAERQRPEQAVGAIENELNVGGAGGDEDGKENSADARIRRGFGIGNHKEREQQKRAALQLLKRNRHGSPSQ